MANVYINANTNKIILNSNKLLLTSGGSVTTYTDNFNSYISSNYLNGQGLWIAGITDSIVVWDVSGNNVVGTYLSSAWTCAIYNNTFDNDQYAQIKMVNVTTTGAMGIGVRLSGAGATLDGYAFTISGNANESSIVRFDNGVGTVLGNVGTTNPSTNDVYKLKIVGTTLTVYKNGSVFTEVGTSGTYTDATYSSGKAGIVGNGTYNDANADDWEAGYPAT